MRGVSAKDTFLATLDREHATTMRVLRAYPADQLDLKPSPKSNSARDLAWIFVLERGLAMKIWNDEFANGMPSGGAPPKPPEDWNQLLAALEEAHQSYRDFIAGASEEDLQQQVHFFTAPKTMGSMSRLDMIWFMLHDEIHHRGQFSVYLRIAGGKLPSIYGPTADEPWI